MVGVKLSADARISIMMFLITIQWKKVVRYEHYGGIGTGEKGFGDVFWEGGVPYWTLT